MLQKFFNPEWQITSKSFFLSSFLIGFSFSPTAEISSLELEFEESRVKEGIGQESNGAANQEKQIFLLCQISPSASSTRDLGTRLCLIVIEYNNIFEIFLKLIVTVILKEIQRDIALLKLFCFRASELFSRTLKKGDGDFPDVACLFFSTLSYMWDRGNEVALS